MEYVNEYTLTAAIPAALVLVGFIVKWTKNKTDDKIFTIVKKVLGRK